MIRSMEDGTLWGGEDELPSEVLQVLQEGLHQLQHGDAGEVLLQGEYDRIPQVDGVDQGEETEVVEDGLLVAFANRDLGSSPTICYVKGVSLIYLNPRLPTKVNEEVVIK